MFANHFRKSSRAVLAAMAFLAASGCASDTEPAGDFATPCSGQITVQVSAGLEPVFSWSPVCGVSYVIVETVPGLGAAPALMWSFTVPEQQPVGSGVTYGHAPSRSSATVAQPLHAGMGYRVRIGQTLGLDASVAEGTQLFTP